MSVVDDYLAGLGEAGRAAFEHANDTIRFTAARSLPDDVVRDLVRHRMAEIDGS
jgi:uncharacterized protein YdhG (YjbR/CyaY superfamily)